MNLLYRARYTIAGIVIFIFIGLVGSGEYESSVEYQKTTKTKRINPITGGMQ